MHRRREPASVGLTSKMRKVMIFTGLLIVALSAITLFAGKLAYQNWFGQNVFAPFAVGIGLLAIGIGIFGPDRRKVHEGDRSHKGLP
jgi:hypothetical protein